MKLYYDAAYGLLFICAGLGIGYFDAYVCGDLIYILTTVITYQLNSLSKIKIHSDFLC